MPRLEVDRARCAAALAGGALATDEVMRRVEAGRPFRVAYREVKEALERGETFAAPSPARIVARRRSTGGLGDLGLAEARARLRRARAWGARRAPPIRCGDATARGPSGPPRMTADRRKRHLKILELISTRAISTQEELAEALAARRLGGHPVVGEPGHRRAPAGEGRTAPTGGRSRDAAVADPDERRIADGVLTAEPAGDSLVVVHTPPGEANRVAVALDRLAWPDVVGTIAGDDTIFLAVRRAEAQRSVLREMQRLGGRF